MSLFEILFNCRNLHILYELLYVLFLFLFFFFFLFFWLLTWRNILQCWSGWRLSCWYTTASSLKRAHWIRDCIHSFCFRLWIVTDWVLLNSWNGASAWSNVLFLFLLLFQDLTLHHNLTCVDFEDKLGRYCTSYNLGWSDCRRLWLNGTLIWCIRGRDFVQFESLSKGAFHLIFVFLLFLCWPFTRACCIQLSHSVSKS